MTNYNEGIDKLKYELHQVEQDRDYWRQRAEDQEVRANHQSERADRAEVALDVAVARLDRIAAEPGRTGSEALPSGRDLANVLANQ